MSLDQRLASLFGELARRLVRHPDEVNVEVVDGRRATAFELHVNPDDRGQLIGREGMTIRAMRVLADISAERHRRRFDVEIPD